jgi:hypothetical protein
MFGEELQGNNKTNLVFNFQTALNGLPVATGCYITTQMADAAPASSAQTHAL